MAKTLVIAEKPSVGRDLTRVLPGSFTKQDGYLESDDHVVTWAVGHLVQLAYTQIEYARALGPGPQARALLREARTGAATLVLPRLERHTEAVVGLLEA